MEKDNAKIDFCVRYLASRGIDAQEFLNRASKPSDGAVTFKLVKIDDSFFAKVAEGLRPLWPAGDKDGKYAWRCSVNDAVRRLKFIWEDYAVDKDYTVEECLEAARQYLSRFENSSTKYMQVMKYFIFKQKTDVDAKGFHRHTYKSTLLDILEGRDEQTAMSEWEQLEGELI